MATPSKIHLDVSHHPTFFLPSINEAAAKKASELLQDNHDNHHIFFRASGFHVCLQFIFDKSFSMLRS
jgi:hypothetical protein